jgi:hypothetical protein
MPTCILTLSTFLVLISSTFAQSDNPANEAYEDRNQIDPQPLKISEVKGFATDPAAVPVPQAQVLLFTSRTHNLFAKTTTDAQGKFGFGKVKHGTYRLVVKFPGFCPANVPIVVQAGKEARTLLLHMRIGEIDSCSYGELH